MLLLFATAQNETDSHCPEPGQVRLSQVSQLVATGRRQNEGLVGSEKLWDEVANLFKTRFMCGESLTWTAQFDSFLLFWERQRLIRHIRDKRGRRTLNIIEVTPQGRATVDDIIADFQPVQLSAPKPQKV